jgi:hypothetical protein
MIKCLSAATIPSVRGTPTRDYVAKCSRDNLGILMGTTLSDGRCDQTTIPQGGQGRPEFSPKSQHKRSNKTVHSFKSQVTINKSQKLKVMFANVEFISYVTLEQPNLIALCEIFPKNRANSSEDDVNLEMDNYDRLMPAARGSTGIVIYAHRSLQATTVDSSITLILRSPCGVK